MWVQFLGWEDLLEKEMANQLQYSCLENSMDWQATVHGVTKSQTQLNNKEHTHNSGKNFST